MPTRLKIHIRVSTAARQTQLVSAIQSAVGARPVEAGTTVAAAVSAAMSSGANAVRAKYIFTNEADAVAVADATVTAATSRGPVAGSFVRSRREDGTLAYEKVW